MSETLEPKLDCIPYHRKQYEAFKHGMPLAAVKAFYDHRRSAKRRGIGFLFSLPEWWAWWQIDGRWERRGRGKDCLVMARRGDVGPYSAENVYAATPAQNQNDVPRAIRVASGLLAAGKRDYLTQRKGGAHPAARPVITPKGRFSCATDAARAYGIHPASGANKARKQQNGWRYEDA